MLFNTLLFTGNSNPALAQEIASHLGVTFDLDGAWAASGRVDPRLLAALASESWFALGPPKSTGRDLFGDAWLDARLNGTEAPQDVQATLAALTALTIAESALRHAGPIDDAIVCGGGAYNLDLLDRLRTAFGPATTVMPCSSEAAGALMPEHVEALGFAWLAKRCLDGQAGNLPSVTGAAGPRVLGAIYPR